ncbi:C6 zinc finger domain-containing protein [Histoplasma capsulatum G186AR]|uniref:C6 zinc finger domain-containing protein n=1 Tax=Ajellomyces capsulatus (strain G186AR / H82 / ATCC MYA-2454 / RMSCC 2432) TaxID=447093 RepID=C0NP08_AJECG|nr:C6 zinc finger domain-containing protein [Histoplasma capsulatum G186AR]EEH06668.1 C6 zinc finger domain-containing protein [Histoplasma capsulatum G186AR]
MAPTVDENLLPPSEFEIPLMNLAAPAAAVAAPDNYPLNGDSYPKATKATINFNTQTQQKKLKNTIGGDRTSPAPVNAPPRTNISGQTNTQKPKRVRTGCLTCRERHLKCDETLPRCQNCQKSDRLCKRGVRLNFIDTHVAAPPYAAPFAHDWQVNFQDESRQIASEYRGGFERYPRVKKETPPREPTADLPSYDFPDIMGGPSLSHQSIPDATPLLSHYPESQQPDIILCATTAVALNVYEIMCENAMQRMNHIAGARALIKECQWDATSIGIGGACFWLNVAMELLSCLHFNWTMAWDPDTWDINMNMSPPENNITGNEELWTHRMVYICAKIANFRSTIPHFRNPDPTAHDMRLNERIQEWNTYKEWCDEWARCVPRSMMPLGYVQPWQTRSKSSFPEVWLIQRTAIVGRLFYHTACCLLAGIHPTETENMTAMQQSHAHDICGIVAHVKDRGVASVSIRCLAIAAECLTNRLAQEEVLRIFEKIVKETGWQVDFLRIELMEKWGWRQNDNNDNNDTINIHNNDDDDNDNDNNSSLPQQHGQQPPTVSTTPGPSVPPSLLPSSLLNPGSSNPDTSGRSPIPSRPRMPQGIVNPLMATADFSYENHPYQSHYVAPHSHNQMEYSHYESY